MQAPTTPVSAPYPSCTSNRDTPADCRYDDFYDGISLVPAISAMGPEAMGTERQRSGTVVVMRKPTEVPHDPS
jgi:hypothetical protein